MSESAQPAPEARRVPSTFTLHPAVLARILVDHYDKTYELTAKATRQRNLMFLLLVTLAFGNLMLMVWPDRARPLLFQIAARAAGAPSLAQLADQGQVLSLEMLQTLILVAGFLVTANLFLQNGLLYRNYRYLSALEHDLKLLVDLPSQGLAFSRETEAYRALADPPDSWLRKAYSVVLAALILLLAGPIIYTAFRQAVSATGPILLANLLLLIGDIAMVVLMGVVVVVDARRAASFERVEHPEPGVA
jgi:hypothetical protein